MENRELELSSQSWNMLAWSVKIIFRKFSKLLLLSSLYLTGCALNCLDRLPMKKVLIDPGNMGNQYHQQWVWDYGV